MGVRHWLPAGGSGRNWTEANCACERPQTGWKRTIRARRVKARPVWTWEGALLCVPTFARDESSGLFDKVLLTEERFDPRVLNPAMPDRWAICASSSSRNTARVQEQSALHFPGCALERSDALRGSLLEYLREVSLKNVVDRIRKIDAFPDAIVPRIGERKHEADAASFPKLSKFAPQLLSRVLHSLWITRT